MVRLDAKKKDEDRINRRKSLHWEVAENRMTEEEINRFKEMNWEWYYNCYLYRDEPVAVMCKVCNGLNVFLPGENKKNCTHCGIECRRCEVDEDKKK